MGHNNILGSCSEPCIIGVDYVYVGLTCLAIHYVHYEIESYIPNKKLQKSYIFDLKPSVSNELQLLITSKIEEAFQT